TQTQIDAGGGAAGTFVADSDYAGGNTYSTTASINTANVASPAPVAVYQSERYGNFTYVIPNPAAGSAYTVRLHFAEIYWSAAGERLFNVLINGVQVLTNFDIFTAAGGQNIAYIQQFTATANSSGAVTIQFVTVKDNAKLSGLEIQLIQSNGGGGKGTQTQIDAGGGAAGTFVADSDYAGGNTYSTTASINTANVASPAPVAVYQSERYGNFTYVIPNLAAGSAYTVRLHFAEIYWSAAGERLFNVLINGVQVLTNFDIFTAAGGQNIAYIQQFTATANSSGAVTIQFVTVKDNAKLSGLEIQLIQSNGGGGKGTQTQIDAGGGAAGTFVADSDYAGGNTYSTTASINTANVASPAPVAVYQSERYGNFTYVIPNLAAGSAYTVRLHFAEIYWSAAGERLFNVLINGVQVLTNFDIFTAAGGQNIAYIQQFTATANSSGAVTIQFVTVKDNAKLSGLEIQLIQSNGGGGKGTQIQIDAGGGAAGTFVADSDYAGGNTYSTTASINTANVASPAPLAVYQSERYGNFTYVIPNLAAGSAYTVRLHFAEIYWSAAGERLFNVLINGVQVLTNFDIFTAAGGQNIAYSQQFTATANSSGAVTIQFVTVKDNAKLSGLEIQLIQSNGGGGQGT